MAILANNELQIIRNACASTQSVNYNKAQINLAAQACEDLLVANVAAISAAIDTATSPFVFTPAQKKKIFAEVVERKYQRDK